MRKVDLGRGMVSEGEVGTSCIGLYLSRLYGGYTEEVGTCSNITRIIPYHYSGGTDSPRQTIVIHLSSSLGEGMQARSWVTGCLYLSSTF